MFLILGVSLLFSCGSEPKVEEQKPESPVVEEPQPVDEIEEIQDDDEVIEPMFIPMDKVKKMIINNEIKDAKTICAISNYLLMNENK